MWVRGLKQVTCADGQTRFVVAPHVGAWIETQIILSERFSEVVAPHVGAWIETVFPRCRDFGRIESHPMWVRGLKLV